MHRTYTVIASYQVNALNGVFTIGRQIKLPFIPFVGLILTNVPVELDEFCISRVEWDWRHECFYVYKGDPGEETEWDDDFTETDFQDLVKRGCTIDGETTVEAWRETVQAARNQHEADLKTIHDLLEPTS